MAQEEHILSSSHSGGGDSGSGGVVSSDRSRNLKQKKIPQRGLGVAQLEKIRLEEQRKREALEAANALANNAIGSVNDAAAPCLTVQSPSFQSPNTLYRSSPSIPIQISNQFKGGGEDTNLQAISGSGNGNWARLWSSDYNHSRNDHLGTAAFRLQRNLQFDSNAAAAATPMPQRSFHLQRPASPVVNATSGISPSVLTSHMEPPSNQNIHPHGSNFASSWPEECKMVGMKRSYPFSLESPPPRSFPVHFDSKSRSDEFPPCSSGYTAQTEPRNMYIRAGPSNPSPLSEQNLRDDGRLNGDFLTLAPPAAWNTNHRYPLDHLEGSFGNQVHDSGPREQPFIFFPDRSDVDETEARVANANGEKGETIDLNLKL
ncbi:hypothetical protein C2S53_009596 [Perilla frutescens var. hirtella]|uniref:Uncharacterized protein n=1 Tax=Perilla frutescens var. hirtella TaxID=608512 RepID=A0AAD4JPR1_PERFH|nr:hypothetical protein C2S53_009596 [Perilla frutescens var. hirtella]